MRANLVLSPFRSSPVWACRGKAIVVIVEQSEVGGNEGVSDAHGSILLMHDLIGPAGVDGDGHGHVEAIGGTVKRRCGVRKLAG